MKKLLAMVLVIAIAAIAGCTNLKNKVKDAAIKATQTGSKTSVEAPTK